MVGAPDPRGHVFGQMVVAKGVRGRALCVEGEWGCVVSADVNGCVGVGYGVMLHRGRGYKEGVGELF